MAQGRGSAATSAGRSLAVLGFLCIFVLPSSPVAEAGTYVVGDRLGWTFNTVGWPDNKSFKAGDVLVFRYNPLFHNLVAVSAAGYSGCTTPAGSRFFTSGNDRVTLARGRNYYICSFLGHCQAGMRLAVTAT